MKGSKVEVLHSPNDDVSESEATHMLMKPLNEQYILEDLVAIRDDASASVSMTKNLLESEQQFLQRAQKRIDDYQSKREVKETE